MNENRKLLELAAKVAEIDWFKHTDGGLWLKSGGIWNPLTDDGDALRLAVKLEIELIFRNEAVWTEHRSESRPDWRLTYCEPYMGDAPSATRLLIVRAAADIGKVRCASNPSQT